MRRPLFEAFPALRGSVPFVPLADLPTSVRVLDDDGLAWLKQDDLTHAQYGGNKVRKLEFIVGEWREQAVKEVVTFGAVGSNACVAAALMCLHEGVACRVLLFDQPLTDVVLANLKAMQQLGATFEYCGSLAAAYLRFSLHPRRLRRGTYFLFAGCSNPAATLAYVNAALELREQIAANQLPLPVEIIVPVGSSSTLAGLTLGCAVAGLKTKVIGVRVAPETIFGIDACSVGTVRVQMRQAARMLAWSAPLPVPVVQGDYFGAGYGVTTDAAVAAMQRFRAAYGLALEGTYTGKAAACFLARQGRADGPVLFWNTFNSRSMAQLPKASHQQALPPRLLRRHGLVDKSIMD